MTNIVPTFRLETEDLNVEFEVVSPVDLSVSSNPKKREILLEMQKLDNQIDACEAEIQKLDKKIDRLTNHADGLDYTIAVASGILCGLIDSFFVGELDLAKCREYGSEKVENFVKKLGGDKDLKKSIENLEEKTKNAFPSDSNMNDYGGSRQHHLRDFAHHPTPIGLAFSLLTQFSEMCYGTDTKGFFLSLPVEDKNRIGKSVPQKIIYGTLYWFLHMASDMAGSNSTAGAGTGLPGPILSLAKELSALPFFKKLNKKGNKEFSEFLSKIYNGTLFAKRDSNGNIIKESVVPIDLRTEIGIIKNQALPVIINECIVRVFYSIRRFIMEAKANPIHSLSDFAKLNWKKIFPFGNRTVIRMLTIATGTFTAFDIADAAIRSGGFNAACLLRVNFVGVGRFAVAIVTDVGMGIKKNTVIKKRIKIMSREIALLNAKVSYKCAEIALAEADMFEAQADMWTAAMSTEETFIEVYEITEENITFVNESLTEIQESFERISKYREGIEKYNPGLIKDISNIAKWGKK